MARYLFQVAYTSEAWAAQLKQPANRQEVADRLAQQLGGRVESFYYAFGDYDVVGVLEVPDNVSAAALSLTVSASGTARAFRTTPLMTVDEGLSAMRKAAAAASSYRLATA